MVESTSLHLLGECDHIRSFGKIEMLVGPEFSRWSTTSLDLINEKSHALLFRQLLEVLEEGWGSVIVTTLGLDGLHNYSSNRDFLLLSPSFNEFLNIGQTALVFCLVLSNVILQGILVLRESGDRPVKGRHVQLVDCFGVGATQSSQSPPVEATCFESRKGWQMVPQYNESFAVHFEPHRGMKG